MKEPSSDHLMRQLQTPQYDMKVSPNFNLRKQPTQMIQFQKEWAACCINYRHKINYKFSFTRPKIKTPAMQILHTTLSFSQHSYLIRVSLSLSLRLLGLLLFLPRMLNRQTPNIKIITNRNNNINLFINSLVSHYISREGKTYHKAPINPNSCP